MVDNKRKVILEGILKSLLVGVGTAINPIVGAGATFISYLSERYNDLKPEERACIVEASEDEISDIVIQLNQKNEVLEKVIQLGNRVSLLSADIKELEGLDKIIKVLEGSIEQSEKFQKEITDKLEEVSRGVNANLRPDLIDKEIVDKISVIKKLRFFESFDSAKKTVDLGKRILEGDLSRGTKKVLCMSLAICARYLVYSNYSDIGAFFLSEAEKNGSCLELTIAQAFYISKRKSKSEAFDRLSEVKIADKFTECMMIVRHHDGVEKAVKWANDVGVNKKELKSEGKLLLIIYYLELLKWSEALELAEECSERDFEGLPLLFHYVGLTYLAHSVTEQLRALVMPHVPMELKQFRLADDRHSLINRNKAQILFYKSAVAFEKLGAIDIALVSEDYGLWLELRSSDSYETGMVRLKECLRDSVKSLRRVHYGLQYGINIDIKAVEKRIDSQVALNGGLRSDSALAKLALGANSKTPFEFAYFLTENRTQLREFFDVKYLLELEAGNYLQSGETDKVEECLRLLAKEGGEERVTQFRQLNLSCSLDEGIKVLKEQFNETQDLSVLINLIGLLEDKQDSVEICFYLDKMFGLTRSLVDGERLLEVLKVIKRYSEIIVIWDKYSEILKKSDIAKMNYCIALYYEGYLCLAEKVIDELNSYRDENWYRSLYFNINVRKGNWNVLVKFISEEYEFVSKRSNKEMLDIVKIGIMLKVPHTKKILFEIASKCMDDATCLVTAFNHASSAGWDNEEEVSSWIKKAAELSKESGPVRKVTLKELLDDHREWNRHYAENVPKYSKGLVPIDIAAKLLKRTYSDLVLLPAIRNRTQTDIRKKQLISNWSGRYRSELTKDIKRIYVDLFALINLSLSDLLGELFKAFDKVIIPHSLLYWLFKEKEHININQPSLFNEAKKLIDLKVRDCVRIFEPEQALDIELSSKVGDSLSYMLNESLKSQDSGQKLVICSRPIYDVNSLMNEEVDLSGYSNISSCSNIVCKLRELGLLSRSKTNEILAFLEIQEQNDSVQPEIKDDAELYLDEVVVSYFVKFDLIEKLKSTGYRIFIPKQSIDEANSLVSFKDISSKANNVIDMIQHVILKEIKSGKVTLNKYIFSESLEEEPTISISSIGMISDALVSDDRYINQYDNDGTKPIVSTIELIDYLHSEELIDLDRKIDVLKNYRDAGAVFIPQYFDELMHLFEDVQLRENVMIETAELKSIRKYILLIRANDWLNLPHESIWIEKIFKTFIEVMKEIWKKNWVYTKKSACSNWLIEQLDVRGWIHNYKNVDSVQLLYRNRFVLLLAPPINSDKEVCEDYFNWIESNVLNEIKKNDRELFDWLVNEMSKFIAKANNN